MQKEKLLVSFSGGETSAFMAQWLWKNKQDYYDMIFVFANTGQENEETLEFVEQCSNYFGFPVVWVEAVVNPENRKGTTHRVVDFETADRTGKVFESVIAKYGIPNVNAPMCNREMKLNAINSYAKSIGWKKYFTAIGIRADEFDRMNAKRVEKRLIYPLVSEKRMTKPKINVFWVQQPFRLNLKGYQGNCKWCWKKSDKKLYLLLNESPEQFEFPKRMEMKYGHFLPESRIELMKERGETPNFPITFFRQNRSVEDLVFEAQNLSKVVVDDSQIYDYELDLFDLIEESESCDIFSECGS